MDLWKDIEGYEGRYQINPHGEVRSLMRHDQRGERKIMPVSTYGRWEVVYLTPLGGGRGNRHRVVDLRGKAFPRHEIRISEEAPKPRTKGVHDIATEILLQLNLPDTRAFLDAYSVITGVLKAEGWPAGTTT